MCLTALKLLHPFDRNLNSIELSFDHILNETSIRKISSEFVNNLFEESNSVVYTCGTVTKSHNFGSEFFSNLDFFIKQSLANLFIRINKEEGLCNKTKHIVEISLTEFKDTAYDFLIVPTQIENFQKSIEILNQPIEFKTKSDLILSIKLKKFVSNLKIFDQRFDFIDLTRYVHLVSLDLEYYNSIDFFKSSSRDSKALFIACVNLNEESQQIVRFVSRFTQSFQSSKSVERMRTNANDTTTSFLLEDENEVNTTNETHSELYLSSLEWVSDEFEESSCNDEVKPLEIVELNTSSIGWVCDTERKSMKRKSDSSEYENVVKKFRLVKTQVNKVMEKFSNEFKF